MNSTSIKIFVAILCAGALLQGTVLGVVGMPGLAYWAAVAGLGVLAALAGGGTLGAGRTRGRGPFLCDSCRYDDPRYCSRPERPNARRCPDYRPR